MFTLHDTIELTKKVLLYGGIAAIIIFLLFMLFQLGVFLKNTFFPTPPPAAEAAYGKLPPIPFEKTENSSITYSLDTVTGDLPEFYDRLYVYKIVPQFPEFYDLTRAKSKAAGLGFTENPKQVGNNLYQWSHTTQLQPAFTLDILREDFQYSSSFMTYAPIVNGENVPDEETAIDEATQFLKKAQSFPETINEASTSATALHIEDGQLVAATSNATSQLYRVDFQLNTVDELPLYFPHSPESVIFAVVGQENNESVIVEAGFIHKDISEEFSDYPAKTTAEAYDELKAGKGYIASNFTNATDVTIRDVQLGYYFSDKPQEYLLPIYVFIGDGFLAYVSAVQNQYIKE